ncbi:hypothetical protein GF324_08775, partial [bacterium]|nr:hypothetical protein [bacterium]
MQQTAADMIHTPATDRTETIDERGALFHCVSAGRFSELPTPWNHAINRLERPMHIDPSGNDNGTGGPVHLSSDGKPGTLYHFIDPAQFPATRTMPDYTRQLQQAGTNRTDTLIRRPAFSAGLPCRVEEVTTVRLDNLLQRQGLLLRTNMLVLEADGIEADALAGAEMLLAGSCRVVLLQPSSHPLLNGRTEGEESAALLSAHGFSRFSAENPEGTALFLRKGLEEDLFDAVCALYGIEKAQRESLRARFEPRTLKRSSLPSASTVQPRKSTIRYAYFGHHKCGTNWIHNIAAAVCEELDVTSKRVPFANNPDELIKLSGGASFVSFVNAQAPAIEGLEGFRGFHVVRDPRDILVSAYFSHRYSHSLKTYAGLAEHREKLNRLTVEDGLLLEMDFSERHFRLMEGWDYDREDILELKMEDLSKNPYRRFVEVFEFLGLDPGLEKILTAIYHNDFEVLSGGRKKGEADAKHHYRKGEAGDWVNHF